MSTKPTTPTTPTTPQDRQNPGARTDRQPEDIRSRSADPGQSSYGGFKNEDPRKQHQATPERKPGKTHP